MYSTLSMGKLMWPVLINMSWVAILKMDVLVIVSVCVCQMYVTKLPSSQILDLNDEISRILVGPAL